MSELDNEINEIAEKMEKASTPAIDQLKETIKELGPDQLKKSLANMDEEEAKLLKSVLEEMALEKSKSIAMDVESAPKKTEVAIADAKMEIEESGDDEDEKLMKEKNAGHDHQGDSTPEGKESPMIKSEGSSPDLTQEELELFEKLENEEVIERIEKAVENKENLPKIEKGRGPDKKPRKRPGRGMGEFGANRGVSESTVQGETVQGMKVRDAKASKDKKEKKELMESAKDNARRNLKELKEMKKPKLAKSDEEKNMDIKAKIEEVKKSLEAEGKEVTKELLKEEVKKALTPKSEKKVPWETVHKSLRANTMGRNYNYSVNSFYDVVLKKSEEKPETEEKIEKSEKDYDLNDLIEKSLDKSWNDVTKERANKDLKKSEANHKTFKEMDIATALGMDEEEAKKLLGE